MIQVVTLVFGKKPLSRVEPQFAVIRTETNPLQIPLIGLRTREEAMSTITSLFMQLTYH